MKFKLNISLRVIFYFFLLVLIGNHLLIFLTVNINCLDDDQVIMWLGASDYAKGIFHEPRYYGQAYNTFMEALVAVPFIWSGMAIYYAVPLATHLIFLTPFLFAAFYLFKHKHEDKAILVLALLLCMPTGYDIMTSIPRGFITGTFFTLFFIINLKNPKNYKFICINTLLSIIGLLVNPNSILVSVPFLFYLFLNNIKEIKYYKAIGLGVLLAIPFELLLNQFYRSHPEYIVYTMDNQIGLNYFTKAIMHLNDHFGHIGPFVEGSALGTLIIFLLIGIYFFRTNKKWFVAFGLFVSIIFVCFFFQKISHGGPWPFFSLSRMFIAIPVFYVCCIVLIDFSFQRFKHVIFVVVLGFYALKAMTFNDRLKEYSKDENFLDVSLFKLDDALTMSKDFKEVCLKYKTNSILIIGWTWRDNIINYAGQVLYKNYPKTFKPHFERRRWITEAEINSVNPSFLIYTRYNNLDTLCQTRYTDVNIRRVSWGIFYVYNNKKTTLNFLRYIKAETLGF
ncbi:MAG: hypothetical protein H7141_02735 [Burkholderiales bacterium]|nr:hypothetical protein [Bacteroidia bacterium]